MMNLAETVSLLKNNEYQELDRLRLNMLTTYPLTMRALRLIDQDSTQPKRRKGFNLLKRENKKWGFVYYVRYFHDGRILPSKWNTHTNVREDAERFAQENKERLVRRYLQTHNAILFKFLEQFYTDCSEDGSRNQPLSERCRKEYGAIIKNKFIPYLKERNITDFDGISIRVLTGFQDALLNKGIKPQSVNNNLKAVKRVLACAARKGLIDYSPGEQVRSIPVYKNDQNARGCYEIERLRGVFNRQWTDKTSYLLCLLIYTTGMRNSEIQLIRKTDILNVNGCRFINILQSKTPNGVRKVPLHPFVYEKLMTYARGRGSETPLFDFHRATPFVTANTELAKRLKVTREVLETEHITFYSGRHFWKTLMSREGLGEDVEEFFMGHKVSSNVAKRYNHRDKQGKQHIIQKAKQVFAILDRCIFITKP